MRLKTILKKKCENFFAFILPEEEIKKLFGSKSVGVPQFMLIDSQNNVVWKGKGYSHFMGKIIRHLLK